MTRTEVAVIVPVWGDLRGLDALLEALRRQDDPPAFEVVLVDNHARPTIPRRSGVRLVHEPRPGSYAARNAGVAATDAPLLAFTDVDCRPTPRWLRAGAAAVAPGTIVGGDIRTVTTPSPTLAERLDVRFPLDQARYVDEGWAATANLFITRSDLDDLGGFDATLMSGGDRELGYRAQSARKTYHLAPSAVVEHAARRRLGELVRKTRRVAAGSLPVVRRHRGRRGATLHVLRSFVPPVRRSAGLVSDRSTTVADRAWLIGASWLLWAVNLWATVHTLAVPKARAPRA